MNTWQNAQQASTLATADRSGLDWTSAELAQLTQLRSAGQPIATIAAALHRSYYAVSTRLQLEGLVTPRTARTTAAPNACTACWLVHAGDCR